MLIKAIQRWCLRSHIGFAALQEPKIQCDSDSQTSTRRLGHQLRLPLGWRHFLTVRINSNCACTRIHPLNILTKQILRRRGLAFSTLGSQHLARVKWSCGTCSSGRHPLSRHVTVYLQSSETADFLSHFTDAVVYTRRRNNNSSIPDLKTEPNTLQPWWADLLPNVGTPCLEIWMQQKFTNYI